MSRPELINYVEGRISELAHEVRDVRRHAPDRTSHLVVGDMRRGVAALAVALEALEATTAEVPR